MAKLTVTAQPTPRRRGLAAVSHNKGRRHGMEHCEVVVMGLPFGTPATLIQEYINKMMVHYFICPSDSPPIVNCWLEGFHTARYAVLVFASSKLATRALDFTGLPFLMETLDIHRRHAYEGPHPHRSEYTANQALPDKYLPEGKERQRWMDEFDNIWNRYAWAEPTDFGLESEEEYNRKLSFPSSTKYNDTEVGREKTAQKAEKLPVIDEHRELQRKQHHVKQPNEQPSPNRKEGVQSEQQYQLLGGEKIRHENIQELTFTEDEFEDAMDTLADIAEDMSECIIPSEQSQKAGADCIDLLVDLVSEELSSMLPDHLPLESLSPDNDNKKSAESLQLMMEEIFKQENRDREIESTWDMTQIADLVEDSPITDKGLKVTSIGEKKEGEKSTHSSEELNSGSSSMNSDDACKPLPNPYANHLHGKQLELNGGWSIQSDCVTVVTAISTDDETEGSSTVHSGRAASGSSIKLLDDYSSVVSAVSVDGDFEDPPPRSIANRLRFTPPPTTTTWQYHDRGNDDCQPLPCPPTKHDSTHHVTPPNKNILSCGDTPTNPHQVTRWDDDAINNTTNTGSLVGVGESGRLPWPRTSHTVRRRVTRKSQSRLYFRVLQQLGVELGVMNGAYKSVGTDHKRDTTYWRRSVDNTIPTKVNVARHVGVLADDRLQEIICHFRKKGI